MSDLKSKSKPTITESKIWNDDFLAVLSELETIYKNKGETFKSRAYKNAYDAIISSRLDITDVTQLKGLKGIGKGTLEKLTTIVNHGKLDIIEKERTNIVNQLCKIYGIGPKKAIELSEKVSSLDELRQNENLLNKNQKIGLKYFDSIEKRIPREEIDLYREVFTNVSRKIKNLELEIVGSYRRGLKTSGDIDVILTSENDADFTTFVNELIKSKIIIEVLSKGESKSLTIGQLKNKTPRRIDFLYSSKNEYSFAILYFTGSKSFNVVMRKHAVDMGYSLNEHGLTNLSNFEKEKTSFTSEKDIFDFLELEFKEPNERYSGAAVVSKNVELKQSLQKVGTKKVKYEGTEFNKDFKDMELGDLIKLIRKASDAYYNSIPIMKDEEFDILRDHLENVAPAHPILKEIGAPIQGSKKINLPFYMPSMNKVKPDSLSKWLLKFKGPFVVSQKLDGVSAMLIASSEKKTLYSRGNGEIGQDISKLIPHVKCISEFDNTQIKDEIVLRGELIINKKDFEEHCSSQHSNARNLMSGLMNSKTIKKKYMKYVNFVVYEIIKPNLIPSEQFNLSVDLGFPTVKYEKKNNIDLDYSSLTLKTWRKSSEFMIDGIIITEDKNYPRKNENPKHSIAFKMVLEDQSSISEVINVVWNPSKHGLLKPIVQIKPINIGGVTVKNISGQNAKYIQSNKIGKGCIVEIVRRGDVIPYIEKIIEPANEADMPSIAYDWTSTNVDIYIGENDATRAKLALSFFSGLNIEGLKTGNLTKFGNAGFKTIPQIVKMTYDDILNIDGFKDKTANKIFNSLKDVTKDGFKSTSLAKLMGLSGIFGRGFGERKVNEVLKKHPDILLQNITEDEYVNLIKQVPGFSNKTATQFSEGIDKFKLFAEELGINIIRNNSVSADVNTVANGILSGKSIVFTGGKDSNIQNLIESHGGIIGSNVSSKVFAVVTKDKSKVSTKIVKAKSLNIPVYSFEEFTTKYA